MPLVLVLALQFLLPMTPARAQIGVGEDAVVLPFVCQIEKGRVTLTPASERSYRVVGPRHSHAFTACRPHHPDQCRTWQIHRFDLACGTMVVPWLTVVAAAMERWPQRGRVLQGRLVMTLGPQWRPTGSAQQPTLMFPRGYAPAIGFVARFHAPNQRPTVVEARQPSEQRARLTSPEVPAIERSAPAATMESVSTSWSTTVDAAATNQAGFGLDRWRAAGMAGVVSAAWMVLAFLRRRHQATSATNTAAVGAAQPGSSLPDGEEREAAVLAELVARAVGLHRASREALAAVPSESLRELLADDLAAVQRVLLAPSLADDVAAGRWAQAKAVVTPALADLERVARIIAGVLSSQPGGRPLPEQPVTAAEAFDLLGINPDASRTVAKKIVDGLRQSWHPDLARSEEDRLRREQRIKQINVAWDLIRSELTAPSEQSAA